MSSAIECPPFQSEDRTDTYFAPAGRDSPEELARKKSLVENAVVFKAAIDAMPSIVLVLNENRQIVGANQTLLGAFHSKLDDILGKRPGELFACVNAHMGPDGCGTARECTTCGAVLAVLASRQLDGKSRNECRLLCGGESSQTAKDVRVTATQFSLESERFTVCAIEDISDQKRLKVLNRIFFHDVLNTAGGISGLAASLIDEGELSGDEGTLTYIANLADQLIEEIQSQRDLVYAESNELDVVPEFFEADLLLKDLQMLYSNHIVANQRQILVNPEWQGQIRSDRRLLMRVLGNLLKNALEATAPGGQVSVGCRCAADRVFFDVHNDAVMPENVRIQIFQRSFSTKGESGRGIGTYSIKLLTEQYLDGTVSFASDESEGTRFTVELPKRLVLEKERERVTPASGGD
jgi:K+-sensing histidine kinase KdpD